MNDRMKRVLAENQETAAQNLLAAMVVADAIDGLTTALKQRELDALLARVDAYLARPPVENTALETFAETIRTTLLAESAKRRAV
jgi:hypothetical protein